MSFINVRPATDRDFNLVTQAIKVRAANMAKIEVENLCDQYGLTKAQRQSVFATYLNVNRAAKAERQVAEEVDRRRFVNPKLMGAARPAWLDA